MKPAITQAIPGADNGRGALREYDRARLPAARRMLPVPIGAVRIVIRLLVLNDGDPVKAVAVARKWASTHTTDAEQYGLIADLLEQEIPG